MDRPKTVAVAGASGFVGSAIVRQLLSRGYTVRAIVRSVDAAAKALPSDPGLHVSEGEVLKFADRERLLKGCDACVNAVGIIREAPGGETFRKSHVAVTRALVDACEELGVRRFAHISALGVSDEGQTEYRRTKFEAETIIRRSSLAWTIFRPTIILGPNSSFLQMAKGWVTGRAFPHVAIPYFQRHVGGPPVPGLAKLEDPVIAPVAVDDVASAVVEALERPIAIGEIYDLAGPERVTMPQILAALRDHVPLGKKNLRLVPMPHSVGVKIARAARFTGLKFALPFDEGMAFMAGQDSVARAEKAREHLALSFRPCMPALAEYAESL